MFFLASAYAASSSTSGSSIFAARALASRMSCTMSRSAGSAWPSALPRSRSSATGRRGESLLDVIARDFPAVDDRPGVVRDVHGWRRRRRGRGFASARGSERQQAQRDKTRTTGGRRGDSRKRHKVTAYRELRLRWVFQVARGVYDDDHDEGRHADLLQGLGHGAAGRLQPRLAADRRRLGRPDGVSRRRTAIAASRTIAAVTAARASRGTATRWTPTPTISPRWSRRST